MIKFHPDENYLTEYSAGSLSTAQSICIATHLEYCNHCQQFIDMLNNIGGSLFDNISDTSVSDDVLDILMNRIKSEHVDKDIEFHRQQPDTKTDLPVIINRLVKRNDKLNWKKLTSSLQVARLATGQDQFEVSLHNIKAGGRVAEHDHKGTEITVVLKGSFSDANGVYQQGDFLLKEPGQVHRPIASQDTDCLCLTAVDMPVQFTGIASILNPFLRVNPQ